MVGNSSELKGRPIVAFSTDWDGDPLSKMHIMRILAKDNRVLWVNSIGNRAPKANTHDLKRVWKKVSQAATQPLREVEPNLHVLSPLAVPLYGSEAVRAANRELLRFQVKRAMKKLGFGGEKVISWSFLPASAPVSGTLGEELVVYHCVDEFSAFSDTNGRHIAELEERLLKRAHLCITSAERLRENKAKVNPNTVLVRHGVDFDHFVKACDAGTKVPEDIARLPHPVIGFFGLVADWVDLGWFEACARSHPEWSVVVLGNIPPDVDVGHLRGIPNLHFLGHKPYAELPGYCKAFDVALMPFKWNELTLNANPLKVREYLAAGLPVVSTRIPEVEVVKQVRIADSREGFVQAVEKAFADPGPRAERSDGMRCESWEAKADEVRRAIAGLQR